MAFNYTQNLFRAPNGKIWTNIGGVGREISGTPEQFSQLGIDIFKLPTQNFGYQTQGWNPQYGGGTSGGNQDINWFQKEVKSQKEQATIQKALSSYSQEDIQNPAYAYVQGSAGQGKLLIPKESLADFQDIGFQEIAKPTPQGQQTVGSFEQYFQQEKAKGRTAQDILQNNPFMAGGSKYQAPTGTFQVAGIESQNPNLTEGQKLWDIMGLSTSGLGDSFTGSPEQVKALKNATGGQFKLESEKIVEDKILDNIQNKIESGLIQPDVEISQQMIDDFLKQAKEEVAPYFSEQFRQKREDYSRSLGQIGEDVTAKERQLEYQYGQNLQNIQEQMANRGLTFSSIRGGKEQNLLSQTQAAIEAGRREAERRALEAGTFAERTLGTSNLPETVGMAQAPKPILGKPGVYGFEPGIGTRTLFAPIGSVTGSLERERLLAEKARQSELVGAERQLRGTAYL